MLSAQEGGRLRLAPLSSRHGCRNCFQVGRSVQSRNHETPQWAVVGIGGVANLGVHI